MTASERIKVIREASGLSQAEFAEIIGVTRQAIYLIEEKNNIPSTETIQAIIDKFHSKPEIFFDTEKT